MTIKIKKGVIYSCEEGIEDKPIGAIFDTATDLEESTLECAVEALPAVKNFIEEVNSGTFKPRSLVKSLEQILDKHAV